MATSSSQTTSVIPPIDFNHAVLQVTALRVVKETCSEAEQKKREARENTIEESDDLTSDTVLVRLNSSQRQYSSEEREEATSLQCLQYHLESYCFKHCIQYNDAISQLNLLKSKQRELELTGLQRRATNIRLRRMLMNSESSL